jgi:hypothetical protein
MYESGKLSTSEIADKLKVSPPTVYDRLRRLGLSTASLPRRYRAAIKFTFTEGEKVRIIQWKEAGIYNTEVALRLGKTIGPVNRIVRELKLPTSSYKLIPVGSKFGALTVIGAVTKQMTYKGHFESRSWAKCDCGRKIAVFNYALRSRNVGSCGCHINRKKQDAVWVRVRSNFAIGARARGHGRMRLSVAQVKHICSMPCFYCGCPPQNELKGRKRGRSTLKTVLKYTGIDQVKPGRGYLPGNVLPCCFICNRAKLDLSLREFLSWLVSIGKSLSLSGVYRAAEKLGEQLERVPAE